MDFRMNAGYWVRIGRWELGGWWDLSQPGYRNTRGNALTWQRALRKAFRVVGDRDPEMAARLLQNLQEYVEKEKQSDA